MGFPSDFLKPTTAQRLANLGLNDDGSSGEPLPTQPNLTTAIDALYLRQRAAKADTALSTPEPNDLTRPLHIEIGRCGDVWLRVPVIDEWQEPGYNRVPVAASSIEIAKLWPTSVTHDDDYVAAAVAHTINADKTKEGYVGCTCL